MILTIAGRELRSMLLSPFAWMLLGLMQLLLAWLFLVQLEEFLALQPRLAGIPAAPGVTQLVLVPLLDTAGLLLLLVTPLLTMRSLSEEYRSGSMALLMSAPLSSFGIVLGKYLALLAGFALLLLLLALPAATLLLGGALDMGRLAAALLGSALLSASLAAVGLLFSSLSRQPAVAAAGSYGLLLFLWIIDLAGSGDTDRLFAWLSLHSHYRNLLSGLVQSSDIAYYLLLILGALTLTVHRLESGRTQG